MFKKLFLILTIIVCSYSLSGCEGSPARNMIDGTRFQTMNDIMESWVGSNESALVSSWGAPYSTYQNRDGSTVLTWKTYRETSYEYGYCVQTYLVDKNGIVAGWKYNFCQYTYPKLKPLPGNTPIPKPSL